MPARLLTVAFALVGCLALVACGGEDRLSADEYRAEFTKLGKQADKAHADVEKAFKAKSVEEIRTRMAHFADYRQGLGDTVADLEPPKDAEDANTRLADGAHQVADEIRATLPLLADAKTPEAAIKLLNQRLGKSKGTQKLDAALSELKKLGYTDSG